MKMASRKSNKLLEVFVGIFILTISLACSISYTPKTQIQPTTQIQPITEVSTLKADCIDGIFPGKSSKQDVISVLGEPLEIGQNGSFDNLIFNSPINGLYNEIVLQNQAVSQVSIILAEGDPLTWSSVKEQYGDPAYTSYSTFLQSSRFYIYPEQGISFTADEEMDIVFIKECFIPMSLDNYLKFYGASLLAEDPFIQ